MTVVRCWLCGNEVNLSQINLMMTYERYLVLTFVLSLLIRFRQYQSNVQFAWQFPQQWPSVFEVIKQHSSIFFTWTTLLPVGVTFAILITHSICYRLIWAEAIVTPGGLESHLVVLGILLPVSLWMIFLDFRVLFLAPQMNFAEIEKNLSKGEYALNSRALSALRFASLGIFNPRKYVESRVADSLRNVRLALVAQLRRWSFHTSVRITFGFLLWLGYARMSNFIGTPGFLGSLLLLVLWLSAAAWWLYRAPEIVEEELASPPPEMEQTENPPPKRPYFSWRLLRSKPPVPPE